MEFCDDQGCHQLVDEDSLTAMADDVFRSSDEASHPDDLVAFRDILTHVAARVWDLLVGGFLVTTHPSASGRWNRIGPTASNLRALGFDAADVKAIVLSLGHFDHAGGLAPISGTESARWRARRCPTQRPAVRIPRPPVRLDKRLLKEAEAGPKISLSSVTPHLAEGRSSAVIGATTPRPAGRARPP